MEAGRARIDRWLAASSFSGNQLTAANRLVTLRYSLGRCRTSIDSPPALGGRPQESHFTSRSTNLENSVFFDRDFLALVFSALFIRLSIITYLVFVDGISQWAVLALGFALVCLSGPDVYLLRDLRVMSLLTPSLLDDEIFASKFSILLYALPALFACIGCSLIARVFIRYCASR